MNYNQKVTKIAKLAKTQHSEMTWAYRAFLRNHGYSPRPGVSRKTIDELKRKGMIATSSIGYGGLRVTSLTSKGIEYCKYHFAAEIWSVL